MKTEELRLWDIIIGHNKQTLLSQAIQVQDRVDIEGCSSLIRIHKGKRPWDWDKENESIKGLEINWSNRRPYCFYGSQEMLTCICHHSISSIDGNDKEHEVFIPNIEENEMIYHYQDHSTSDELGSNQNHPHQDFTYKEAEIERIHQSPSNYNSKNSSIDNLSAIKSDLNV